MIGGIGSSASISLSAPISKENRLNGELESVKNQVSELKSKIQDIKSELDLARQKLKELGGISTRYGGDAAVRLKDGKFKVGQFGVIKNIVHGSRYKAELNHAAKLLGEEKHVSVSRMETSMQGFVVEKRQERDAFEQDLRISTAKSTRLQGALNKIAKRTSKAETSAAKARKATEDAAERRVEFATIYQTNVGAREINKMSRSLYGKCNGGAELNSKDVISEYKKAHGDNIFSRGNAPLLSNIKALCSDLPGLVEKAAQDYYVPSTTDSTSYRGQGMRLSALKMLISRFDSDRKFNMATVYRPGQFFSTSTDKKVADTFASISTDEVKVIYRIKGNSGAGVSVSGGLTFSDRECELLYSPLARFEVLSIRLDPKSNTYDINLRETAKAAEYALPW